MTNDLFNRKDLIGDQSIETINNFTEYIDSLLNPFNNKLTELILDLNSITISKEIQYKDLLINNLQIKNSQLLNKDNTKERNNKEISFTERKEKFLEWFNLQKEINLGKKGLHKTLSKTTENNLKLVLKTNYDPNDLVRAFKNMCQNKYVSEHNLVTPDHFLRIDNLERYINQDDNNQNVYVPEE